jgi:hypothetical protein
VVRCCRLSALAAIAICYLGLRSSDSLLPRLSHDGLSALTDRATNSCHCEDITAVVKIDRVLSAHHYFLMARGFDSGAQNTFSGKSGALSVCGLLLILCGCAAITGPMVRRVPSGDLAEYEAGTNTCNSVILYCSWFRGSFGNWRKEWDGFSANSELVTGLHPATKSEFDFKVREYPSLRGQFSDKMSLLREVATEIEDRSRMTVTSESVETMPVEQSYQKDGKLTFRRENFTFLRKEGALNVNAAGIYKISGTLHFVHYLTDVHSDAETNVSAIVFHAMAYIPETVPPAKREYLLDNMKHFITAMDLGRDPKSYKH